MAVKEECCYIGRGEIFLRKCLTDAEIDAGVVSEFISVGNTEEFTVSSEVNTITKKNYISKCGGIECSYSSIDDVQLNLKLCCYKDLNVGLALAAGCIEVAAQPEMPGAETSFTFRWEPGDSPDIPLPADFDTSLPYEIRQTDRADGNAVGSLLNALYDLVDGVFVYNRDETTNNNDGPLEPEDGFSVLTITYTTLPKAATPASKKFNMFSCNTDVYELQFRGCNAAKGNDGREYILDLYKVCFEPASEFQFITEEFGTIELTGRLLPDRNRTITGTQDGTAGDFPSEYGAWCIVEPAA